MCIVSQEFSRILFNSSVNVIHVSLIRARTVCTCSADSCALRESSTVSRVVCGVPTAHVHVVSSNFPFLSVSQFIAKFFLVPVQHIYCMFV